MHIHIPQPLPRWMTQLCRELHAADPQALITGDAVAAAFFGGHFGPTALPFEVSAWTTGDARELRGRLEDSAPGWRWEGRSAAPEEALRLASPLLSLRAGLRLGSSGELELLSLDVRTAELLAAGELERAERAPADEAQVAAARMLAWYPALRANFLEYDGKTCHTTLEEIHEAVANGEFGGRRTAFAISEAERAAAQHVEAWHQGAGPAIEPVAVPCRSPLPAGDPWHAPDGEFREWIIDQVITERCTGGRDAFLHEALALQRGTDQKPTHQGWETYQHAVMSMLVLDTSEHDPSDRRALRLAMLYHDIGKLHNVWTPGSHPLIGARVWIKHRPPFITDTEASLITELIRNHDALGLMDRGLRNSAFRGGMTPAEIRAEIRGLGRGFEEGLRLLSSVYQADIGSVPALRWLMPLTPLLEDVVRAGQAGEAAA